MWPILGQRRRSGGVIDVSHCQSHLKSEDRRVVDRGKVGFCIVVLFPQAIIFTPHSGV